jgi:hypothetical protein
MIRLAGTSKISTQPDPRVDPNRVQLYARQIIIFNVIFKL